MGFLAHNPKRFFRKIDGERAFVSQENLRNLLSSVRQAETFPALAELLDEFRRVSLAAIASHSSLSAELHQRAPDFSEKLKELTEDLVDAYEDLEESISVFVEVVEQEEAEELPEILEELEECLRELELLEAQRESLKQAEDKARPNLDDFYS